MDNVKRQNGKGSESQKIFYVDLPKDVFIRYSLYCRKLKATRKSFFISLFSSYVAAHSDFSLKAIAEDMKKNGLCGL